MGDSDPVGSSLDNVQYHSMRGGLSLALLPGRSADEDAVDKAAFERDHDVTWSFRMDNVPVAIKDTIYWCKLFPVPDDDRKLQQIGARTVIQPIENKPHVHHILVYSCDSSVTAEAIGYAAEKRFARDFLL